MVYYAFSDYLKQRYGEKVYKLPLALPVTCPNRDGTCGTNGCTFCGAIGAGYENLPASMSIAQQLASNKAHIIPKYKAKKFIPYMQNFSNTYLPAEQLEKYTNEAVQDDDVVALYIATRPDCISEYYLARLSEIKKRRNIDICIELGLQTVNYHSLQKINRGHTLAEFIDAVMRIKQYDMQTCAHIILNLPWDDMTDVIENAKMMSALQIDQVKLHALYIVKNTQMSEDYLNGKINLISLGEYKERVECFLQYLSPSIVLQRLIGRAPEKNTLFSNWHTGWWKIRDEIISYMEKNNLYQGKLCNYLNGSALKKFNSYN
ncbi:TIGR01212 family radical SAM protein [Pectinatus haikarae]|uniref:TIGR01212 family radical SAM protein n=1 Tax=Pectinatus haikarae TaxID=349096 RepID=UPI0018C5536B|nr:TIGR01212 family radical SAM protein [Pectinatus haikarae]